MNSNKSLIIGELRTKSRIDITLSCTTTNGIFGAPIIDYNTKKVIGVIGGSFYEIDIYREWL